MRSIEQFVLLLAALVLTACGGGDSGIGLGGTTAPPPRGTLQGAPEFVTTIPASALLLQLSTLPNQQLLSLSGTPVCDVAIYRIRYTTVGGAGEATDASAALMVPTGADARCRGPLPIVLYAHATTTDRAFNIANLQDPDNAEGLLMAVFFATQRDIVVAPNFAGYDSSALAYHPYLVGDPQSKDMIDALRAARTALPLASLLQTSDSGRLFITGYSQGGYVAMATHRAMQAAGMIVTAAAPMSGPYAIAAFVDAVFAGRVNSGAPVFSTLLITAYQKSYGNIYATTADVFEPQYANGIDSLLPSTTTRSSLYAQGKLPKDALFSLTPPDPAFADITPATTPTNLAPTFAQGFGANNLIKNSYRLSYLRDAAANPDGGWPTTTTGVTAVAPVLPLRKALQQNDLRNWIPTAPAFLCGGDADPTVFWLNTQLMQGYWAARAPASATITILDIDASALTNDPYANLKNEFRAAKLLLAASAVAKGATDGGASAVADAYHSTLVPPFCLAAVKSFFTAQ